MSNKHIRKHRGILLAGILIALVLYVISYQSSHFPKNHFQVISTSLELNRRFSEVKVHQNLTCSKWAVTDSLDGKKPSEGIRRFLYDPSWCLVIVKQSEEDEFKIVSSLPSNIFILDQASQDKMGSSFVKNLPSDLSSRRNAGYIFALAHKPNMIFDFDSENEIKFWMPKALPKDKFAALNHFQLPTVSDFVSLYPNNKVPDCPIFDPIHPQTNSLFKKSHRVPSNCKPFTDFLQKNEDRKSNIGIIHSMQDYAGAIQYFKPIKRKAGMLLPKEIYIPYGSESSIYYESSFWALFTPSGQESGKVLRSYVVKVLCDIFNIDMGFTLKSLTWTRGKNAPASQSELSFDLDNLVKDLSKFKQEELNEDLPSTEIMLSLWNYMFRKKYITKDDLNSARAWLQTLINLNVPFPGASKEGGTTSSVGHLNSNTGKPLMVLGDLEPKCQVKKHKTFWTSDLHDGSRADFPLVLSKLNQTVWVSGIKKKTNRFGIFEYPGIRYSQNLSPTIQKIGSHSTPVSEEDIANNAKYYEDHPIDVDAFMCQFPASMCEVWMPLKKSIVFLPAHRYNLGRCTARDWKRLNANLKGLDKSRNFMGALSRYDMEYMDHYTNLSPRLFPSYGGVYLINNTYKPRKDQFVYFGGGVVNLNSKESKRQKIVKLKPYKIEDLTGSKGIIYEAYSVMSFKLTEFYNMGIPLLMPSLDYYRKFGFGEDRTSISNNYCKDKSLISFSPDPQSAHPFNPNIKREENQDSETYWLQFSDFYDWPHILHYDNVSHLHHLIDHTDFSSISEKMLLDVKIRKKVTYDALCSVINQL